MKTIVVQQKYQQMSDIEVIDKIKQGEKALYEILIRRYNQKLYRVVRSYIKDENDVEDSMQNVYLQAFEHLYQFKGLSQFSTWIIRIAINESLARLKQNKKHFLTHHSIENPANNMLNLIPDSKLMNPENKTINEEVRKLLEQAIDNLPLKYRSVYMMREVEGMNLAETAACLEISETNVKVRLHRAKTLLKEFLYENSIDRQAFEFGFARCDRMTKRVMDRI